MTFNNRLVIAFLAPAILFVAGLVGSIWALGRTQSDFDNYLQTEQAVANGVREMYAQGLQMGQALRNILLDPANPKAYDNMNAAKNAFDEAYVATQRAAQGTPTAASLEPLAALRSTQAAAQEKVLAQVKIDVAQAVDLLNREETPAWRALRGELLKLKDASSALSAQTRETVVARAERARWVSMALALSALVTAALLGLMVQRTLRREIGGDPAAAKIVLRRIADGDLSGALPTVRDPQSLMGALVTMQRSMQELVTQVHQASAGIHGASSEIASGNQDLSARTEQAASNLEETAASMEQLTSTVRQSADAARQANQLAASASAIAVRGGQVVGEVVTTMEAINHSSKKISDIIGVIDGIAFQTNILALNAAVEAARAGEQGRGFAVVAGEVRNLAQRSAEAAKEIKSLIGASVDKVEAGSRLVADAGQTMSEIVGSVQRVSDIIGEITAAAGEQSDGIGQVNVAVNQLDQMTQQNAALVEESAAAAESLKDQANRLAQVIQVFRLS
ncbi:methyl-accepting chemotaxis protein [Hydrogenophaga sp. PAMC20947]|uniref:methyl-accepting chemotaxis protein n=1 Tax=Hydrogenophaga sp. PAMC20947 TaxID=2565558 RepID=UPI00109DB2C3|nr:methyl-accepting chemotaxis protein [Hydrogenophaga sp. PAMC20947]QCB47704.1 chemotaxis protein [Hydrogenophaga sp. PAMC20947]